MHESATGRPVEVASIRSSSDRLNKPINRKIWLPKLLYEVLPWFYLGSGVAAFLATLYISEWFWILPHYLLFSAACIHLGLFVLHRRRNGRRADGGA